MSIDYSNFNGDICFTDGHTIHTILKDTKYLCYFVKVSIISYTTKIIESYGRANVLLYGTTKLHIENVLYFFKLVHRNLLNFKNILLNEYHIKTRNEENIKYLYIMRHILDKTRVVENLSIYSSDLYYTYISTIEI